MSFTWVMDHFLYIPIIGLIGIVVAGIETCGRAAFHLGSSFKHRHSHRDPWDCWPSNPTGTRRPLPAKRPFGTYTIDRNPGAWLAHNNLGKLLLQAGEPEQAMEQFNAVIHLKPESGEPYNNLGNALVQLGRIPEASAAYNESLKRDPYSPETNNNLGIFLAQTGHTAEALSHFEQALRRHPLLCRGAQ